MGQIALIGVVWRLYSVILRCEPSRRPSNLISPVSQLVSRTWYMEVT